ncbi:hypothetical protein TKK_0013062 [Trichogramma kaykai]|uniref:acid phosphatase n=1 Tax=Trichogramma kaykai TaxID=54128 RepID=A0ABD2WJ10_9HYME
MVSLIAISSLILCVGGGIDAFRIKINDQDYELDVVQVLFRHGDRYPTPEEIYPLDPYNLKYYRPKQYGQLTNVGKNRAHKLGKMLRRRYDSHLGEYEHGDVYGYSTDVDRTKMTLQLVLAGLYPPSKVTAWSDSIGWSPIPYQSDRLGKNFLMTNYCERFDRHYDEALNSPELKAHYKKYERVFNYVRNKTDANWNKPLMSMFFLHNHLKAIMSMGLPLPEWSAPVIDSLEELTNITYHAMIHTPSLARMTAGPTIEKMLSNMLGNDEERKIFLYSAHDVNVAHILRAHRITTAPPLADFTSAVLVEKYSNSRKESFVKMLYWTGPSEELITLTIPGCGQFCPLEKYSRLVENVLPDALDRECTVWKDCSDKQTGMTYSLAKKTMNEIKKLRK